MTMLNWDDLDFGKFADENQCAAHLTEKTRLNAQNRLDINQNAVDLVKRARDLAKSSSHLRKGMMESFLEEFGLSNKEGLALMCLAESLLRIPDAPTADKLIAGKISSGDWGEHKGQSESWLVNASTWGLMLTGSIIDVDGRARKDLGGFMKSMTRQVGEPVIRGAMMQAMRIMGEQFVVGRTIETALERAKTLEPGKKPAICSFDMLGEAARTAKDAQRYYDAYSEAIFALGSAQNTKLHPAKKSGISVKLSALHPRYETIKERRLFTELYPKIKSLAVQAAQANINFTLDAEESDRLVISLKLLEKLVNEEELGDWEGLGLAVQAYQKRGLAVCGKLAKLARECRGGKGRKLMVRLVKGAYWDSEIKLAQMAGHPDFPVWTRKATTDLAYLACARSLLDAGTWIYAQFATHNAHTVAAIEEMVRGGRGQRSGTHYEFQRLHGMGDALYAAVYNGPGHPAPCRVYAPVGAHEDLLPYLVRRLLENGANTSFVHSFLDDSVPAEHVAKSPFLSAAPTRHDKIPSPPMLFGEVRKNSRGLDLTQKPVRVDLEKRCGALEPILAGPIVRGKTTKGVGRDVIAPASGTILGTCRYANEKDIYAAYSSAEKAFSDWDKLGGCARAKILLKMADALEDKTEDFTALMALEAGKCFEDGFSEVREAVDFLRYYAGEAMNNFSEPKLLPGPSGETNHLSLCGRGVFVCISPWNFPLAIFIGQIAAALAAGNTVLAKPAEQTSLIAFETVKLFQKSGLPKDVLHMLTGTGQDIGAKLVNLPDIAGVCFTGSTEVAQIINRNLAAKDGPIPVLIAETGGINGMFVDTSALKEQVVDDVIASAFNAAGQRCSALRVLFLPHETADEILECLMGAMDELAIGDPSVAQTDIGPVIDEAAKAELMSHISRMKSEQKILKSCTSPSAGSFVAPTLVEINTLDCLGKEVFGPVLHVLRYKNKNLTKIAKQFAGKKYGLTLGVHSRIDLFAKTIREIVPAGNFYVNRNMIGAVVGVQPFGGVGLSGTGPKAGGPHYLPRFASERTVTINITAQGGDPALLNLD